jgi:hypothetical protein
MLEVFEHWFSVRWPADCTPETVGVGYCTTVQWSVDLLLIRQVIQVHTVSFINL